MAAALRKWPGMFPCIMLSLSTFHDEGKQKKPVICFSKITPAHIDFWEALLRNSIVSLENVHERNAGT